MAKKNKQITESYSKTENIRLMKPTEWAREEGLDFHLFLHWENQQMSHGEYVKLKQKVIG